MKGKISYQAAPSELFRMRFRRAEDQCQVFFSVGSVCLIAMFWKFGPNTGHRNVTPSRSRSLPRSAAEVYPALQAVPPILGSPRGNCPWLVEIQQTQNERSRSCLAAGAELLWDPLGVEDSSALLSVGPEASGKGRICNIRHLPQGKIITLMSWLSMVYILDPISKAFPFFLLCCRASLFSLFIKGFAVI